MEKAASHRQPFGAPTAANRSPCGPALLSLSRERGSRSDSHPQSAPPTIYISKLLLNIKLDVRPVVMSLKRVRTELHDRSKFLMDAIRHARVVSGEIPFELRHGKANNDAKSR